LVGLNVGLGPIREASLGYVDDVATLGHQEADLITLDTNVREFESVSGAILNRNRKCSGGPWLLGWQRRVAT
jgi:hypothetical protein